MKAFITTVAGLATRFSSALPEPVPKCIYTNGDPRHTLLYRMTEMISDYDCIVIVGGFMFDTLNKYIADIFPSDILNKTIIAQNREYDLYGSGWSLLKGLDALRQRAGDITEILFAEGDLYFDRQSFEAVKASEHDVITVNSEPILAEKAVALYLDLKGRPRYIYDTSHGELEINEPFTAVYNSAQIWKFSDVSRLYKVMDELGAEAQKGTNLVLINRYFMNSMSRDTGLEMIHIREWVNTNTLKDFESLDFN